MLSQCKHCKQMYLRTIYFCSFIISLNHWIMKPSKQSAVFISHILHQEAGLFCPKMTRKKFDSKFWSNLVFNLGTSYHLKCIMLSVTAIRVMDSEKYDFQDKCAAFKQMVWLDQPIFCYVKVTASVLTA